MKEERKITLDAVLTSVDRFLDAVCLVTSRTTNRNGEEEGRYRRSMYRCQSRLNELNNLKL